MVCSSGFVDARTPYLASNRSGDWKAPSDEGDACGPDDGRAAPAGRRENTKVRVAVPGTKPEAVLEGF